MIASKFEGNVYLIVNLFIQLIGKKKSFYFSQPSTQVLEEVINEAKRNEKSGIIK
jgi:hypothetical protein